MIGQRIERARLIEDEMDETARGILERAKDPEGANGVAHEAPNQYDVVLALARLERKHERFLTTDQQRHINRSGPRHSR